MFCRNCGNELPEGTRFCDKCGADQTKLNSGAATPGAGTSYSAGSNPYTMGAQPQMMTQGMGAMGGQSLNPIKLIPDSTPDFVEKYENDNFFFKALKFLTWIPFVAIAIIAIIGIFTSGFGEALIHISSTSESEALSAMASYLQFLSKWMWIGALSIVPPYARALMLWNAVNKQNASVSTLLKHIKALMPSLPGEKVTKPADISLVQSVVVLKRGGEPRKTAIVGLIIDVIYNAILFAVLLPWTLNGVAEFMSSVSGNPSFGLLVHFIPAVVAVVFRIVYAIIIANTTGKNGADAFGNIQYDWFRGTLSDKWEEKSKEEAIPYTTLISAKGYEDIKFYDDGNQPSAPSTPSGFNPYVAQGIGAIPGGKSEFRGSAFGLIGQFILASIITTFTLGIGMPWAICGIIKWIALNTTVSGRRLNFRATGGSLFGNYLKWWFLSLITFGIYGLFVPKKLADWLAENVTFV